ncbi:MAG: cytochrome c3 family protein [Desulfobacterales bacterium]|jgi:hypothetical protein
MMRKVILILIVCLLVGTPWNSAFSQEDMEVVGDVGFSEKRRTPAVFRHDEHNEAAQIEECNECHHIYEDGQKLEDESSEDQSCSDCHSEEGDGDTPGLRKAFHTNCKGCHLESGKGPVMCGTCHIKRYPN